MSNLMCFPFYTTSGFPEG